MIEPKHTEIDLPLLDRSDDPRGGAIAWALLAVGVTLLTSIILTLTWVVQP